MIKRLSALCALTALVGSAASSHAATVTYAMTGGAVTGTLAGIPFSGTSFIITATADTSSLIPFYWYGSPTQPGIGTPVTPTIQIVTETETITATLLTSTVSSMSVFSVNYFGQAYYGFDSIDYVSGFASRGMQVGPAQNNGLDLATLSTSTGTLINGEYSTNLGALGLVFAPSSQGSFTISAVPEPATATSSLILTLAGFSLVSRRRRI